MRRELDALGFFQWAIRSEEDIALPHLMATSRPHAQSAVLAASGTICEGQLASRSTRTLPKRRGRCEGQCDLPPREAILH